MIALRRHKVGEFIPERALVKENSPGYRILYSELVTRRHFIIVSALNDTSRRQKLYGRFSIRRKEVRQDLRKVS